MNLTKLQRNNRIAKLYEEVVEFSVRSKRIAGSLEVNIVVIYIDGRGSELSFGNLSNILKEDYENFMSSLVDDVDPGSYFSETNKKILVFERVAAAETFCSLLTLRLKENNVDPLTYSDCIDMPGATASLINAFVS